MSERNLFRLVHLPPDLAKQLRDSVDEAFQSLGGATAELILHYARRRHNVDMKELPLGIDELDNALKEILGSGRKMVVTIAPRYLAGDSAKTSEQSRKSFRTFSSRLRRSIRGELPQAIVPPLCSAIWRALKRRSYQTT